MNWILTEKEAILSLDETTINNLPKEYKVDDNIYFSTELAPKSY